MSDDLHIDFQEYDQTIGTAIVTSKYNHDNQS